MTNTERKAHTFARNANASIQALFNSLNRTHPAVDDIEVTYAQAVDPLTGASVVKVKLTLAPGYAYRGALSINLGWNGATREVGILPEGTIAESNKRFVSKRTLPAGSAGVLHAVSAMQELVNTITASVRES